MEVKIHRILFLALNACYQTQKEINTSSLTNINNECSPTNVRIRKDKHYYKYGEDTNFGGLRGNYSTLLTWRGFRKTGKKIDSNYSIGMNDLIINALKKGDISLHFEKETCFTQKETLADALKIESYLRHIREDQAHIKEFLKKNPRFPLKRDTINFPKESVVVTKNNQLFIRGRVNNFFDYKNKVLQYSLINFWEGTKIKKFNIHPLIVIPKENNAWAEIYAIRIEDLIAKEFPILLNVNMKTKECFDNIGNKYKLYSLEKAIKTFSNKSENIEWRITYNYNIIKEKYCNDEIVENNNLLKKESEFSVFLKNFLQNNFCFSIFDRNVIDIKEISSGGPDVILYFKDKGEQTLELEHQWINYINHKHYSNTAFKNVWLYANEKFEFDKIKKMFEPYLSKYSENIPKIFLFSDNNKKCGIKVIDWEKRIYTKIIIS